MLSTPVSILKRLLHRESSGSGSSSSPGSLSPITDKGFPVSSTTQQQKRARGSVGSDYSGSTSTSASHRIVRALSTRLRTKSNRSGSPQQAQDAVAVQTLKYKRPKASLSSVSLSGLRSWGKSTRPALKKPSQSEFGLRSYGSHDDTSSFPQLAPDTVLAIHSSPKSNYLTIPEPRAGPSKRPSTETLLIEHSPSKMRAQSLPVENIVAIEPLIDPIRLEKEIQAEAIVVPPVATSEVQVTATKLDASLAPPPEEPFVQPSVDLMQMLGIVENRLSKLNYGAVNISASYDGISPSYSWSALGWDPQRGASTPLESPPSIHPAFEGMLVETDPGLARVRELDIESNPQGRTPGTTTVAGLGWERWEVASRGRRQTVFFSQGSLPPLSGPELVRKLQTVKRILEHSNAAEEADTLRTIIGPSSATFLDADNPYNSQAGDLLRVLNREDLFEDFSMADSVYLLAIAPPPAGMGVRLFLLQVLLGYELYLRLKVCPTASSFPGLTQQVNSTLVVAVKWVENVSSEIRDGQLKVFSNIHKSQVEGLLSFAEAMQWPLLEEVKDFATSAYSSHLDGKIVDVHFLDWLYGTTLPGRWFAHKIMTAIIYASRSLRTYGTTPYFDAGLILEDKSYWRTRTPLAHVLGGLSNVKSVAGWVGPCPPVQTADGTGLTGWMRIKAQPVEFGHTTNPHDDQTDDEHELQERGLRVREGETPISLLQGLADMTKWVSPPMVPPTKSKPVLESISLELLPLEDEEDFSSQQSNATVSFKFEDKTIVTYKVLHNPVLVSSPPCVSGPHLAHSRELERYRNVVDVRDLKDQTLTAPGKMILINATGGGDSEAVARAWCSETGRHAVISRGGTTCLTCAFNTTENLELEVLIVSADKESGILTSEKPSS